MGRTGSALDNAVAEAFNSTLEFECFRAHPRFTSREQARQVVAAWIDEYNNDRRHSTCGMVSPVAYELAHRPKTAAGRAGEMKPDQHVEAAPPPPSVRVAASGRRAGYGAASPASRVRTHRASRDGPDGPPLTPEPPRPLTRTAKGRPSLPRPTRRAPGHRNIKPSTVPGDGRSVAVTVLLRGCSDVRGGSARGIVRGFGGILRWARRAGGGAVPTCSDAYPDVVRVGRILRRTWRPMFPPTGGSGSGWLGSSGACSGGAGNP